MQCADITLCGLRAHLQVLEVTVVRDRHSGESKGFGFVRMGTEQGAAAALQALDNYLIGAVGSSPPSARGKTVLLASRYSTGLGRRRGCAQDNSINMIVVAACNSTSEPNRLSGSHSVD